MKIQMAGNLQVACADGTIRECRAGDVVSVYHANGRRLLYGHLAKWVGSEPFDPAWEPPQFLRAAIPQKDKMMRGAINKGLSTQQVN